MPAAYSPHTKQLLKKARDKKVAEIRRLINLFTFWHLNRAVLLFLELYEADRRRDAQGLRLPVD